MTDLEKFKQLFDEIGIPYTEEPNFFNKSEIELVVDDSVLLDMYNVGLDIRFSDEGKFKMFIPSGE